MCPGTIERHPLSKRLAPAMFAWYAINLQCLNGGTVFYHGALLHSQGFGKYTHIWYTPTHYMQLKLYWRRGIWIVLLFWDKRAQIYIHLPHKGLATLQSVDQWGTQMYCNRQKFGNIICIYFKFDAINVRYIPHSKLMEIGAIYGSNLSCEYSYKKSMLLFKFYIRIGFKFTRNTAISMLKKWSSNIDCCTMFHLCSHIWIMCTDEIAISKQSVWHRHQCIIRGIKSKIIIPHSILHGRVIFANNLGDYIQWKLHKRSWVQAVVFNFRH